MGRDFSLAAYAKLVRELRARGYEVCGFAAAQPGEQHLILRHDIDMSVDAASKLASLERELGVAASYFVLMRSELYNPFSRRNRAQLWKILDCGHQVGLHFDASLYPEDFEALERACEEECRLLETCLGRPVELVSFHRPAQALLETGRPLGNRRHTYEPRFFSEMGYCSDSRGDWHHGHPLEHPAVAARRALQLLTHPIWWVAEPGESPVQRLDRLCTEYLDGFRRELAANCEPYRAALGDTFAKGSRREPR